MSESDQEALRARVEALEAGAARDREELERLRRAVTPPPPKPPRPARPEQPVDEAAIIRRRRWRLAIDVGVFAIGAAVTFSVAVFEIRLHWALGALAAPIGGVVVVMLGRAGVTI